MPYPQNIIQAFGGQRAMSRATGFPQQTIAAWKKRRSIPDQHKNKIMDASESIGAGLTPADFFPRDQEGGS